MGQYDRFVLRGGLDTATPYLSRDPGLLTYCRNFELDTDGGYRMSQGFERFDGHPSPSGVIVQNLHMLEDITGLLPGQTIAADSGATGVVGKVDGKQIWVDTRSAIQFQTGDIIDGYHVQYVTVEPVGLTSFIPGAQRTTLLNVLPDAGFNPQPGLQAIGMLTGARVLLKEVIQTYYNYRLFVMPLEGSLQEGETLQLSNGTTGTIQTIADLEPLLASPYTPAGVWYYLSELRRSAIQMVPGTGPVRGVWELDGTVYAFRDNAGIGVMYEATPSGWSVVHLGETMTLSGITSATNPIISGDVLTGVTSGATLTVGWFGYRGTGHTEGYVSFETTTGIFQMGEDVRNQDGTVVGKVAGLPTANQLAAGGTYRFVNHNYFGGKDAYAMYCANAVNMAFTYSKSRGFSFIPTGADIDLPFDVIEHTNSLFLAMPNALLQWSAPLNPFDWSGGLGAGAFTTGSEITGLVSTPSSLIICTQKDVQALKGTDVDNFAKDLITTHSGLAIFTAKYQSQTFALTRSGITAIERTDQFGNFMDSTISEPIRDLLTPRYDLAIGATARKEKGHYIVHFENDVNILMATNQSKVIGFAQNDHGGKTVRTSNNPEGRLWFTSDDGYVYQDDVGPSNDGEERICSLRTSYSNQGDPNTRKRYRRIIITCTSDSYLLASFGFSYDKGRSEFNQNLDSGLVSSHGGRWDQSNWNEVYWDSAEYPSITSDIDGSGSDISFSLYISSRIQTPFVAEDISYEWSPRRKVR